MQRAPDAHRAAGVDDRHAARADDEADVCDVVVTGRIQSQGLARVDENSRSDFADTERVRGGRRRQRQCACQPRRKPNPRAARPRLGAQWPLSGAVFAVAFAAPFQVPL
jgi:hypothetical protein